MKKPYVIEFPGEENAIEKWKTRDIDRVGAVNNFSGTWAITDHDLIPEAVRDFLFEAFSVNRKLHNVELSEINRVLNENWMGPGSIAVLREKTYKMKRMRHEDLDVDPAKILKDMHVPTIEDFNRSQ